MSQKILIDGSSETQTQFALLSDNVLEDFEFESSSKKNLKGNIYLGKVSRIEASLQAAFVEIGSEKNGFLAFGEIHPNYFQIPVADRESLIQAEAEIEEAHNENENGILENPTEYNNVEEQSNSNFKNTITNTNYILMVMLALAANDVIKFYINRSIKLDNGNHKYFLYYIGALVLIIYLLSRTINKYVN